MKQYHDLCRKILLEGTPKMDRTGVGALSLFGHQLRFDLSEGFPLLTTKKTHWHSIVHELLWFISGDTNIKYLQDNKVRIWNEWADENGDLGPVYGKQWRAWNGPRGPIDQLAEAINLIKNNPDSRRIIVSAWNPSDIPDMALPPCHSFFQFYVANNKLSLQLYQRSMDCFLGAPFNFASYALLIHIVADMCGLQAGELVHSIGDAHIYLNHIEQTKLMLSRKEFPLPTLRIKNSHSKIEDYKFDDFELIGYVSHPPIKGKVAV